jgi:flagellar export protein FliJ
MRRFSFPLERVLWHRRCQEERGQHALALAIHAERELEGAEGRLRGQAAEAAKGLQAMLAQSTTGTEVWIHLGFAAGLARQQRLLADRRRQATAEVAERRVALRELRRAREVVEQLRASALARHRQEGEREAQRLLDEAAGARYSPSPGSLD